MQAGGRRFDPVWLHQTSSPYPITTTRCADGIAAVMSVFAMLLKICSGRLIMAILICKIKLEIKLLADRTASGNLLDIQMVCGVINAKTQLNQVR